MTGRHRNWHRRWHREGQRLVHDSGLVMEPVPDGTGASWSPVLDSLTTWRRHCEDRGVRSGRQQDAHLGRLLHEAELWRD